MFYFSLSASDTSVWEKIAVWYQNSVIHEIFAFLEDRYFSVEFRGYENLSLGANANKNAQTIVLALMFGIILAAAVSAYTRTNMGKLVRSLLSQQIHSPEEAKSLSELGLFRNSFLRRELSVGINLRRVIRCREEEEYNREQAALREAHAAAHADDPSAPKFEEKPYRMDFLHAHFYIPEELRYRADVRYNTKGSGWLMFAITTVATVVFAALICYFLPDLVQFIDNIISFASPN